MHANLGSSPANSTCTAAVPYLSLDELLEGAVEGRAERLDILVEVNGKLRTLGNAFWSELEFLNV